jgi:hypothetical protein
MSEYRVTWEIDIEADSPREAAWQAREYQLDPDTGACVFEVAERADDGSYGTATLIDLAPAGADD